MAPDDEIEEEVLRLLKETDSLSFNEIIDYLERKMSISSPKLSRRLRHLVDLGVIKREIIDDWPPRSSYSMPKSKGITALKVRNPRAFYLGLVILVYGLLLAVIVVNLPSQRLEIWEYISEEKGEEYLDDAWLSNLELRSTILEELPLSFRKATLNPVREWVFYLSLGSIAIGITSLIHSKT
jgi:DNA-binding Lrp family transcriptional regulator